MSDAQEHTHSYSRVITSTTGPHSVEGVDGDGKLVVTFYYVDYWENRCACGDVSSSGSDTRSG